MRMLPIHELKWKQACVGSLPQEEVCLPEPRECARVSVLTLTEELEE